MKTKRYSEEFNAKTVKALETNSGHVSVTAIQLGLLCKC